MECLEEHAPKFEHCSKLLLPQAPKRIPLVTFRSQRNIYHRCFACWIERPLVGCGMRRVAPRRGSARPYFVASFSLFVVAVVVVIIIHGSDPFCGKADGNNVAEFARLSTSTPSHPVVVVVVVDVVDVGSER